MEIDNDSSLNENRHWCCFYEIVDLEKEDGFYLGANDLAIFWSFGGVRAVGIKRPSVLYEKGIIYMLGNDFLCVPGEKLLNLEQSVTGTKTYVLIIKCDKFINIAEEAGFLSINSAELKNYVKQLSKNVLLFHYPQTQKLIPSFEVLYSDRTEAPYSKDFIIVRIVRLLQRLSEISEKGFVPLEGGSSADDIASILKYIRENFDTVVLKDLRREMNYDPRYLSELLKKNVGMNFRELVDLRKTIVARDYLQNSKKSLEQISIELGFVSYSGFYKFCLKHLGMAPGEYRKNFQGKNPAIQAKEKSI